MTGGLIMSTMYEEKDNKEELRRFYLQQKSVKAECGYGSKNCDTCTKKDCTIRPYVES